MPELAGTIGIGSIRGRNVPPQGESTTLASGCGGRRIGPPSSHPLRTHPGAPSPREADDPLATDLAQGSAVAVTVAVWLLAAIPGYSRRRRQWPSSRCFNIAAVRGR